MNHEQLSNGWRWLGLIFLVAILVLLSLLGYGPTFSGSQAGCCGVPVAQGTLPAPGAIANAPINLGLKDDNGKITLTGVVPAETDHQAILTQANGVYGAGNYIDQIVVAANASLPEWWPNLHRTMSWLKGNTNFGLSQLGEVLTLTGSVPTEAVKGVREGEVRALFSGNTQINNLLTIASTAPIAPSPTATPPCSKDMNVAILFATNSATISQEGKQQLDEVAKCIAVPTEVGGHTDSDGSDAYNLKLSEARARAVVAYIKSIDKAKGSLLAAVGHGETNPIADNVTEEGKAKNRRIEFVAK